MLERIPELVVGEEVERVEVHAQGTREEHGVLETREMNSAVCENSVMYF